MSKRVKFPLILKNGTQVRTMAELRDSFDFISIYEYVKNGRLSIWLEDRGHTYEAEAIAELNVEDHKFVKRICDILSVPYLPEYDATAKVTKKTEMKLEWLKEVTDEPELLAKADKLIYCDQYRVVAFGNNSDTVEIWRISDMANMVLLNNVCSETFIPMDTQSVCFLTKRDNAIWVEAVNIVRTKSREMLKVTDIEYEEKFEKCKFSIENERIILTYWIKGCEEQKVYIS